MQSWKSRKQEGKVRERFHGWNKFNEGLRDSAEVKKTIHKVHHTGSEIDNMQVLHQFSRVSHANRFFIFQKCKKKSSS